MPLTYRTAHSGDIERISAFAAAQASKVDEIHVPHQRCLKACTIAVRKPESLNLRVTVGVQDEEEDRIVNVVTTSEHNYFGLEGGRRSCLTLLGDFESSSSIESSLAHHFRNSDHLRVKLYATLKEELRQYLLSKNFEIETERVFERTFSNTEIVQALEDHCRPGVRHNPEFTPPKIGRKIGIRRATSEDVDFATRVLFDHEIRHASQKKIDYIEQEYGELSPKRITASLKQSLEDNKTTMGRILIIYADAGQKDPVKIGVVKSFAVVMLDGRVIVYMRYPAIDIRLQSEFDSTALFFHMAVPLSTCLPYSSESLNDPNGSNNRWPVTMRLIATQKEYPGGAGSLESMLCVDSKFRKLPSYVNIAQGYAE